MQRHFDKNQDGYIDAEVTLGFFNWFFFIDFWYESSTKKKELKEVFYSIGRYYNDEQIAHMLQSFDTNGDGVVRINFFLYLFSFNILNNCICIRFKLDYEEFSRIFGQN